MPASDLLVYHDMTDDASAEARGWRPYHAEDPDEEGEIVLAAYCRAW